MAPLRSRRLRLLEGLRRTLGEMLHDRVTFSAVKKGRQAPVDTSAIYTAASSEAPEMLDQLLLVHHRVMQERGDVENAEPKPEETERKRMLSAVRATLRQSEVRYHD